MKLIPSKRFHARAVAALVSAARTEPCQSDQRCLDTAVSRLQDDLVKLRADFSEYPTSKVARDTIGWKVASPKDLVGVI